MELAVHVIGGVKLGKPREASSQLGNQGMSLKTSFEKLLSSPATLKAVTAK